MPILTEKMLLSSKGYSPDELLISPSSEEEITAENLAKRTIYWENSETQEMPELTIKSCRMIFNSFVKRSEHETIEDRVFKSGLVESFIKKGGDSTAAVELVNDVLERLCNRYPATHRKNLITKAIQISKKCLGGNTIDNLL